MSNELLHKAMRYYNMHRSNAAIPALTDAEKDQLIYYMADKLHDFENELESLKTKFDELDEPEILEKSDIEQIIDDKNLLDSDDKIELERSIESNAHDITLINDRLKNLEK